MARQTYLEELGAQQGTIAGRLSVHDSSLMTATDGNSLGNKPENVIGARIIHYGV